MSTLYGGQLTGSGTTHWGNAGLGVPGASIPSAGTHGPAAAYEFLSLPAQNAVEVRWRMVTYPSSGAFYMGEDTGFTLTGALDGVYTFTGELFFDGVSQGNRTQNITVGVTSIGLVGAASAQPNLAAVGSITQVHELVGSASTQTQVAASGVVTQVHELLGAASVQPNDSSGGAVSLPTGGVASPAEVWAYVLANGKTAAQNVLETRQMVEELYRIHGLRSGEPLLVSPTQRTTGDLTQSISESSGVVTVERM